MRPSRSADFRACADLGADGGVEENALRARVAPRARGPIPEKATDGRGIERAFAGPDLDAACQQPRSKLWVGADGYTRTAEHLCDALVHAQDRAGELSVEREASPLDCGVNAANVRFEGETPDSKPRTIRASTSTSLLQYASMRVRSSPVTSGRRPERAYLGRELLTNLLPSVLFFRGARDESGQLLEAAREAGEERELAGVLPRQRGWPTESRLPDPSVEELRVVSNDPRRARRREQVLRGASPGAHDSSSPSGKRATAQSTSVVACCA